MLTVVLLCVVDIMAAGRPVTSPLTGLPLPSRELKPNNLVKSLVLEHLRAMQTEGQEAADAI
jgi:hypothetical protein